MGLIIGLFISWGIISGAYAGTLSFGAGLLILVYSLMGSLFPRIVGASLSTVQGGAAIAGIASLLRGNFESLIACVIIFVVCFGGQHLIVAIRPNASALVGAESPLRAPSINRRATSGTSSGYNKARNNYEPGYWHHLSAFLGSGEIPLGQINIGYQYIDRNNEGGSKAHTDHRWAVARYTDESIQFSRIQGYDAYGLIEFQFEPDEPISYEDISEIEIVETGNLFIQVRFKSETLNFNVVVDVNKNYQEDVECLIDVWKASQSGDKYKALSLATNDPRMKALYALTSEDFSRKEITEARALARTWKQLTKPIYQVKDENLSRYKYSITSFMNSNYTKLSCLIDPKYLFRYIVPTKAFYESLWHREMGGDLILNFEDGLTEANAAFELAEFERPAEFDSLVERTRNLLNTPHAIKILSDTSFVRPE
jgi:hypothetical protein